MLNPINFITPPLLFLYVSKFCLEERLARPPAAVENFLSLLIFPAPYGAADTSPAGCSRPCSSQKTSSGSGCHLSGPWHLSEQKRAQQNRDSSPLSLSLPPDKSRLWNIIKRYCKEGESLRLSRRLKAPHCYFGALEDSQKDHAKCMPGIHTLVCALSGILEFAFGRSTEERVSSWFVID